MHLYANTSWSVLFVYVRGCLHDTMVRYAWFADFYEPRVPVVRAISSGLLKGSTQQPYSQTDFLLKSCLSRLQEPFCEKVGLCAMDVSDSVPLCAPG